MQSNHIYAPCMSQYSMPHLSQQSYRCLFNFTTSKFNSVKNYLRAKLQTWFFMVGSAPCASSSVHNCVRPFCAASCKGVNAHRSVAFTHAPCFISSAAISTWPYDDALCNGIKPPLSCTSQFKGF